MSILHAKQSGLPADGGVTSVVQPSDWYADHVVTGLIVPPVTQSVGFYNGGATTAPVTLTATPTRALVAMVLSTSRGASSITQTNVTWTNRYSSNAGGAFVEIWTGAISGTAGTLVTSNYASSTTAQLQVTELDVSPLTAVGTAVTATTGLLTFPSTGATDGQLCVWAECSFNGNTGWWHSTVPQASILWGGCLMGGFFYFRNPMVNIGWFQSGGYVAFSAAMSLS